MPKVMLVFSLAVAVAGGASTAWGQDKADGQVIKEIQKQDTVPPATGRNLSEQAGTTEPSSKVPATNPEPNVFVNGGAVGARRHDRCRYGTRQVFGPHQRG